VQAHGAERVNVAVLSDDIRLGVKGLSNYVIAGSLRNAFRRGPLLG